MDNESTYQNDWALDIKGKHIHISVATSGLNGYYCLGCKKEMQAVKRKNENYISYFRHHAHNIEKEIKCVHASRIYREKIAEQILHRLKFIKAPPVYKYNPADKLSPPNLIAESKIIQAFKVRSQLTFYEDDNCEISWGKNPKIKNRNLLVIPDIVFFDNNDKPILFIEFVITHKITSEKKAKLSRIGINTIQIIVPRVPEEEIEKELKTSNRIKWVYNDLEANTKYVRISQGNPNGILSIDQQQRKLFEESLKCRSAKIKNLIRSINKCLESELYRRAKQKFEFEISRIEKATEREGKRLEELEGKYRERIYSKFQGEADKFELEKNSFNRAEEEFQKNIESLENRYLGKKGDLDIEIERTREKIEQYNDDGTVEGFYQSQKENIKQKIRETKDSINDLIREEELLSGEFKRDQEAERDNFERIKKGILSETAILQETIDEFEQYAAEERNRIEDEYKRKELDDAERIMQRNIEGDPELSTRIKDVLGIGGVLSDYTAQKQLYERYKEALQLIRSGTWEKKH